MIISALVYREAVEKHDILAFLDILIEKIISRKKTIPCADSHFNSYPLLLETPSRTLLPCHFNPLTPESD